MTIKELEQLVSEAAAEARAHGYVCGMRNLRLADLEQRLREAKAKEVK